MAHVLHLHSSGSGFASKTACGRNLLRTPMSAAWDQFKEDVHMHHCDKCKASRLFAFLQKQDLSKWEPEDSDEWKRQDDALIASRKAA
jgi:hypothetical protein